MHCIKLEKVRVITFPFIFDRFSFVSNAIRAYSRPILRLAIECCHLLRKLSFVLMQNTYSRIGVGVNFLVPFFQKKCFFHKKVPFSHKKVFFLANIERCPKFLEYSLAMNFFIHSLNRVVFSGNEFLHSFFKQGCFQLQIYPLNACKLD